MIQPLPTKIHQRAVELGVTAIELRFSGGSDEGYLNVFAVVPQTSQSKAHAVEACTFEEEVEEWAWEAYSYNGAGDGDDYGDDITYDLVKNQVSHQPWLMERRDQEEDLTKLIVSDEFKPGATLY
jgi:hypothetical protein